VPPKDYVAIPTPLNTTTSANRIFENLDGKQIWHITAPADVPLSSLREIAMDKVLEGDAMVSHKGIDYTFSTLEKDDQSRSILIPNQRGFKAGQFVTPLYQYRWLTQVK